jgi:hypothetical protein
MSAARVADLRNIIMAEFPKLGAAISIAEIATNSPDDITLSAMLRETGSEHGMVLDLPYEHAVAALRSYLGGLESERFAAKYPGIVILNEDNINEASLEDLREILRAIIDSAVPAAPMTIEKLAAMLESRTRNIAATCAHTQSRELGAFMENRDQAVSIATQGILEAEMMYALRDKIQSRWSKSGITDKAKDPIRELVVITDPAMTRAKAEKYLNTLGLMQYVELVMADDLAATLGTLKAKGIVKFGIRSREGEIKDYAALLRDMQDATIKLELGAIDGQYLDTNSYEVLLELFAQGESQWKEIPGITKDERRNIFIYIPRAVPFNYEKEIREHQEAIALMMSAA